jgi:hypothetical protein
LKRNDPRRADATAPAGYKEKKKSEEVALGLDIII